MDTSRRMHHTPHGHHHHVKGHHKQSASNLHQHYASEAQSYESKYETSYSYGDDYSDDRPAELLYSDGEGSTSQYPQSGYVKSIYEPVPDDQDSMHNSHVSTKVVRPPETNQEEPPSLKYAQLEATEMMLNDAPQARTQNLISQEEASSTPEGKPGGAPPKSRVQANGLVKKHRAKSADAASGGGRWTLTYQGGPSEAALNNSVTNVTAQIGGAAFLPCRVGHLGDRQISWIRSRDWHVLTSGNDLYTPDPRFSVLHEPGTQDWTLHIKYAFPKDNGTYECQVSTGTGIISLFVNLRVVTPEAHIPGRGQYHVNRGSPIILTCIISKIITYQGTNKNFVTCQTRVFSGY
ncbi:hypothetical protein HAZT_HAZT002930 [Hyalella azteca]|uniref:Ig-like domain-containing protein n=1 Tax=Hyalella azteca TaxID=294128 RepID=A0A6A0H0U7_HYAAZ|nr:hypothetical protein HAZT_HAZT002930 [Hyalella azteca]